MSAACCEIIDLLHHEHTRSTKLWSHHTPFLALPELLRIRIHEYAARNLEVRHITLKGELASSPLSQTCYTASKDAICAPFRYDRSLLLATVSDFDFNHICKFMRSRSYYDDSQGIIEIHIGLSYTQHHMSPASAESMKEFCRLAAAEEKQPSGMSKTAMATYCGWEHEPRFRLRFVLLKDKCIFGDLGSRSFARSRSIKGIKEHLKSPWVHKEWDRVWAAIVRTTPWMYDNDLQRLTAVNHGAFYSVSKSRRPQAKMFLSDGVVVREKFVKCRKPQPAQINRDRSKPCAHLKQGQGHRGRRKYGLPVVRRQLMWREGNGQLVTARPMFPDQWLSLVQEAHPAGRKFGDLVHGHYKTVFDSLQKSREVL